jgi:hypothetical protein
VLRERVLRERVLRARENGAHARGNVLRSRRVGRRSVRDQPVEVRVTTALSLPLRTGGNVGKESAASETSTDCQCPHVRTVTDHRTQVSQFLFIS